MSRIGNKVITVPAGVEITVKDNTVVVKGPKGTLEQTIAPTISAKLEGNVLTVSRANDEKENKSLHGLTRTLINNMVIGVTEGFSKKLEINGVGYKAAKEGKDLVLSVGYSHDVKMPDTADVTTEVTDANHIVVKGINKQKVGQFAAEVRNVRPPEPYKGKGIKYEDEVIRRKEGKTGK